MLDAGVETRFGRRLGRDFQLADLAAEGFAGAYLALGCQRTVRLPHCGPPEQGFLDGLELLKQAKRGSAQPLAGPVLVIGGGNVAMDVAKTALRLGASEVRVIFLETRETMPAHTWECDEALAEGVMLVPASATVSFEISDGRVRLGALQARAAHRARREEAHPAGALGGDGIHAAGGDRVHRGRLLARTTASSRRRRRARPLWKGAFVGPAPGRSRGARSRCSTAGTS